VAARRVLVFLDASVLVAASRSLTGGSALVLEVCSGRRFRGALTNRVLLEARKNISLKFGEEELVRLYRLLAALDPEMVPAPPLERIRACGGLIAEKDAHVLAGALECKAGYLVTLDRRHFLTPALLAADLPTRLLTPGDFLREVVRQQS